MLMPWIVSHDTAQYTDDEVTLDSSSVDSDNVMMTAMEDYILDYDQDHDHNLAEDSQPLDEPVLGMTIPVSAASCCKDEDDSNVNANHNGNKNKQRTSSRQRRRHLRQIQ